MVANRGPVFTQATAGGIHEILIFSPEHDATWGMLGEEQISLVMAALRDRLEEHAQRPNLRYTQAIVNSGREAGASLEHPHGQLLGMSFIPRELAEEQARFARFVGSCLLCTTIEAEEDSAERVIYADDRVVVICPFWSAVPYEMLVIPREHLPHLHRSPTQDLLAVGEAIRRCLAPAGRGGRGRGLQHRVPLGARTGSASPSTGTPTSGPRPRRPPDSSWVPAWPSTSCRRRKRRAPSRSRTSPDPLDPAAPIGPVRRRPPDCAPRRGRARSGRRCRACSDTPLSTARRLRVSQAWPSGARPEAGPLGSRSSAASGWPGATTTAGRPRRPGAAGGPVPPDRGAPRPGGSR